MNKEELLKLPVSIGSWVILNDNLEQTWDIDILYKIISDYFFNEIPLFKVELILNSLQTRVSEEAFQSALDFLFSKNLI